MNPKHYLEKAVFALILIIRSDFPFYYLNNWGNIYQILIDHKLTYYHDDNLHLLIAKPISGFVYDIHVLFVLK